MRTKTFREENDPRVAVLGTRGSGKTTVLGLLCLGAVDWAVKDEKVRSNIIELSSGMREVPSKLRRGKFPLPTPLDVTFESELVLEWSKIMTLKQISLPFVETAGETIQQMINRFARNEYEIKDLPHAKEIHDYILQADGFIIIVSVPRVLREGSETEPENISADPDVNVARFLDAIRIFKEANPETPRIKGLALVFTKYDAAQYVLPLRGMNLKEVTGVDKFTRTYFPQTYAALEMVDKKTKNIMKSKMIRFFYSSVEIVKDEEGNPILDTDDTLQIVVDRLSERPKYSKESYTELLKWVVHQF